MLVELVCPYEPCRALLSVHIDTQGDPSVNVPPDGIESVEGSCVHAASINDELEDGGEEAVRVHWPSFMEKLDRVLDEQARAEASQGDLTDDDAS